MEKLRTWRNKRGISQKVAGEAVGISAVQWSRFETGERGISAKMALKIEALTGIPRAKLNPVFGAPKRHIPLPSRAMAG